MLILLGLVFIYLRRRRSTISKLDNPPMTPVLPMQGAGMMESGFLRPSTVNKDLPPLASAPPIITPPTPRDSIARHSIAPSYYSDPSYASDAGAPSRTSSLRSSAMLVPKLPTDLSQAPAAYRNASRGSGSAPVSVELSRLRYEHKLIHSPLMQQSSNGSPRRPSRRPPPLEYEP